VSMAEAHKRKCALVAETLDTSKATLFGLVCLATAHACTHGCAAATYAKRQATPKARCPALRLAKTLGYRSVYVLVPSCGRSLQMLPHSPCDFRGGPSDLPGSNQIS
jgi:hypothetical protein